MYVCVLLNMFITQGEKRFTEVGLLYVVSAGRADTSQGQVWGQHTGETCSHPVISKEFTEGAILSKRGAPLGHI